ncbi:hypothetical protein P3T32_004721 [Ralstonia sp. GP73]|jgi:hypothetical protein|uniref:Uncharacterized protein n=1 Tax=Ralstonia thomasii TaxID=3058596 RepID=A0AAD2BSV0_9RALS|nr:hypothetical protein [Ralstonia pickettii]MDH6644847.1 hypothetical protein [Ralstonia sp. GP73]CAJ0716300.1 hypothetical protein LMG7143_03676 [Ralstonia sp. LMG 18095]MBB0036744.1 hypothetical protein [Ralstonia pickettii]MBB0099225.1 hypothetical protein [Ralstonia pickettii]
MTEAGSRAGLADAGAPIAYVQDVSADGADAGEAGAGRHADCSASAHAQTRRLSGLAGQGAPIHTAQLLVRLIAGRTEGGIKAASHLINMPA